MRRRGRNDILTVDRLTIIVIYIILNGNSVRSSFSDNNFPPRFSSASTPGATSEIVVRVKEGPSSLGKEIYRLVGEDPDGDSLTFGVLGAIGSDILKIENVPSHEAIVYLRKELDRETRDSYSIVLTLTDGKLGKGNFITKSMLIIVEDINDNEPVFRPFRTTVSLSEESRPGIIETLEAFDQDEGRFGQVLYKIQEVDLDDNKQANFAVETVEGKGVISLIGSLDYERQSLYQLKILAIDRAIEEERRTATATLLIRVEDAEDQPPVFTFVPSVTRIPENLPLKSHVLHVTAVDGDRGVNNAVTYRITKGSRDLFSIDSSTGVVSVNGKLDRESSVNEGAGNGAFILEIQATEVTITVFPPPSVLTEVTIMLTDVNDEKPTFRSSKYEAEINENAQIDMPVKFIGQNNLPQVYDFDQGNNGTFSLSLDGEYSNYFDINPSEGVNEVSFTIRVKDSNSLDFEKMKSMSFNIVAQEKVAFNAYSSTARITVHIRDVNDNIPQFEKDMYKAYIYENAIKGAFITQVKAFDNDSGNFGTSGIRYTELRGDIASKLNLDRVTGIISVKTSDHGFDRETISQYYITVEARDNNGNGNRNTVQIQLAIEDVNDNPPRFLNDKYEARIYENELNFLSPIVIKAVDDDLIKSPNSEIRYSIVDEQFSSNFSVDPKTGKLKVIKMLDFEAISQPKGEVKNISVVVRASDLGTPSLFSDIIVNVLVYDKNDHSPQFLKSYYSKAIPEDTRDGSMVLQVRAIDGDHSPTNSRVFYRISTGSLDKFIIDADSGMISVANGANLDPDRSNPKQTFYVIHVAALDGSFGEQQRRSQVIVNISIIDVNNKPPEFLDPGKVSVPEDAPINFFVTRVTAKDIDDKPVLRYSIDYGLCEAKNENGIAVDFNLFREAFNLNSLDGTIRVGKALDREKWDQIKLFLIVEDLAATTPGQKATAYLTIRISDVNDNRPIFYKPTYRGTITENAAPGTPVLTVIADDKDLNKSVTYSFEGPRDITNLVSINSKTGEITVKGKVDRETYPWINLTLRATDSGPVSLTGMAFLNIQVLDENDNNPVFEANGQNEYFVSEDAPIGSLVAQVKAVDEDIGEYGKVTYLLDSTSSYGKFKIDKETGAIIIAQKLDREEVNSFNLLIQALDNYEYGYTTGESRRAFKQLRIEIMDVNDQTPIINPVSGCFIINEFHPLGEAVAILTATDKDDTNSLNGKMLFAIVGGNEDNLFAVSTAESPVTSASLSSSSSTALAKIYSRFSLRGRIGNFTLTLQVQDSGSPQRSSESKISICVMDVNDHSPVFVFPPTNYTVRIPENATIGTPIIEVRAQDADSGQNAMVHYKLRELPNGHWKAFKIEPYTGLITLAKTLDRERQKIYELRLEAYDLGEPTSLSTDLDLTILVKNVDDFEPEFTEDIFRLTFTENVLPGQESFKLLSTVDKDEVDDPFDPGFKSIPCYFIVGGNDDDRFKLDILTHQLSTTKSLDREEQSNYTIIVQATNDCLKLPKPINSFDPRDNTLLKVLINVNDVNDNPPKFTKKIFTGGVTTESDFGTVFMAVKAIDRDYGANSVVNYYIIGPIKRKLSEGLDTIKGDPFLISRKSGEISLNFDPQRDMKGYFEFEVLANDTDGLADSAKVYIYLLREDQRVRFVLRLSPQELRERLEKFRDVLGNITGAIVNVDNYKFHENQDGSVDKKKTDLYLHFVNPTDNSIMEVNSVLKLIDKNIDYLNELYKEFNVLISEPSELYGELLNWDDQVKACLMGSTAFLSLLLILVTCLCINQRNRYERQLKAATTTAFGQRDQQLSRANVPNTNIHADGNPIWMAGYDNEWYKDEEQISQNSGGNNSLDENAVGEATTTEPTTPTDSLNGSARGSGSASSTNDRQALCRGITGGRLTPQNITLPSKNKKSIAPKPPPSNTISSNPSESSHRSHQVTCKNSINTVYISSAYCDQSHYHPSNLGNNLSIMNLETTEL